MRAIKGNPHVLHSHITETTLHVENDKDMYPPPHTHKHFAYFHIIKVSIFAHSIIVGYRSVLHYGGVPHCCA